MLRGLWIIAMTATLAGNLGAQTTEDLPDPEEVHVYVKAVSALLGEPEGGGVFYVAARQGAEGGGLVTSPVPETVTEHLAEAGYQARLAELAENGLWDAPRGELFLMLRTIEWWPGRKIAVLNIDLGPARGELQRVRFIYKKDEESWVLIEKGPAEGGS